MTDRHGARRIAAFITPLAALALLVGATGCTGGSDGDDAAASGPPVIAPGKPGEEAGTVSPEEAKAAGRKQTQPNGADFTFHTMMVEHHKQALLMSEIAGKHAENAAVGKLADRIKTAQAPEIRAMEAWLRQHKAAERPDAGHQGHHDHSAMPGMATEKQLAELRAARGAEFDALFVKLMSAHHEGAVTMAREVLAKGNDITTSELATEMAAQQKAEINRMRTLL